MQDPRPCVQDQDSIYVLEEPQDQDHGLQVYNTDYETL